MALIYTFSAGIKEKKKWLQHNLIVAISDDSNSQIQINAYDNFQRNIDLF